MDQQKNSAQKRPVGRDKTKDRQEKERIVEGMSGRIATEVTEICWQEREEPGR